jgi:hypothetical protein
MTKAKSVNRLAAVIPGEPFSEKFAQPIVIQD